MVFASGQVSGLHLRGIAVKRVAAVVADAVLRVGRAFELLVEEATARLEVEKRVLALKRGELLALPAVNGKGGLHKHGKHGERNNHGSHLRK